MNKTNDFSPTGMLDKIERTPTVPFQRFELHTNTYGQDCLYCFVEGKDLPYYSIRVEAVSGIQCCCIDSGGKKNVVSLCQLLKNKPEYSKYKTAYFVDRDYDDNSTLDNSIYVTPCYSVENLYRYDKIVDKLFQLPPDSPNYETCKDFIKNRFQEFINACSKFCAWYYCIKQSEQKDSIIYNVDLSDNIESKYVDFIVNPNIFSISPKYSLDILNSDYNTTITKEDLNIGIEYINQNPQNNIRGKYIFQFLEKLLEFFNIDSGKNGKHRFFKNPTGINADRKRLMLSLNLIAVTPPELKEYIIKQSA